MLKFSEKGRIYSKTVENIPKENTSYHVIYVLYVDSDHEYAQSDLAEYNAAAQEKLDIATKLGDLNDVERYLDRRNSLDESDLLDLLD
ncbi:hypothetical protein [Halorussus salinus]|uniref:hypothetical protein n=1 Tax=Halorussus salinus TaxID=1364935 RepID=UPI00109297BF|nr:hypothetical protein [Halorussus salinus]